MIKESERLIQLGKQMLDEALGEDRTIWMERMLGEMPNIMPVLEWLEQEQETLYGLQLTYVLQEIWFEEAYTVDGLHWFKTFLTQDQDGIPPAARASSLDLAGAFALNLGQYQEAQQLKKEGLDICRTLSDESQLAYSLMHYGHLVGSALGEFEEAKQHYQEAFALFEQLEDECGLALAAGNLAKTHYSLKEWPLMMNMLQFGLPKTQVCGTSWESALNLGWVSGFFLQNGQYPLAVQFASASKTHQERLAVSMPEIFLTQFKSILSDIKEDDRFPSTRSEWDAGQVMSLETAVSEAIEQLGQVQIGV